MTFKVIFMGLLYLSPLVLIAVNVVSHPLAVLGLYALSGLGMAGIGMGVMHDANHSSLSKNRKVNKILGQSMDFMGCSSAVWNYQHNLLHHTFTNIDEFDEDIDAPFFLKFSPNQKRFKIHRFQHFYAWFFYALATLHWVTAKDFVALKKYKEMGLISSKNTFRKENWKALGWKLFYFSYALVLPLLFNEVGILWVLLGFAVKHFVTGLFISTVFQLAHVMPDMSFPKPENKEIDKNWYVHQLETTSNFAPRSKWLSWCIGGLNFQIEHHLFPNVSHIHYREISKIIKKTALEFNMPYHQHNSFFQAIYKHFKMLRALGKSHTSLA